jgi:hypothetical protein
MAKNKGSGSNKFTSANKRSNQLNPNHRSFAPGHSKPTTAADTRSNRSNPNHPLFDASSVPARSGGPSVLLKGFQRRAETFKEKCHQEVGHNIKQVILRMIFIKCAASSFVCCISNSSTYPTHFSVRFMFSLSMLLG